MVKVDDRVTVVTATMPGREWDLAQCVTSVNSQTVQPYCHLIRSKIPGKWGPSPIHLAEQRNELLRAATTEWVAVLDDDDRWLPNHLETVGPALSDADVVFTYAKDSPELWTDVNGWSQDKLVERLETQNVIPSNALIRLAFALEVGGYPTHMKVYSGTFDGTPCTWEDWALWLTLARAGAKFRTVPKETWVYAFDPKRSSQTMWNRRLMEMGATGQPKVLR